MSQGKKIGLALMFSVRLLSCAMALRRVYLTSFVNYFYLSPRDLTYTTLTLYILSLLELTGVYLVYLMPSIPRAISESALFYRLVSIFKS